MSAALLAKRGQAGQAIVELALTLPVLVLIAALILTLSLLGVARLATENAASEGARVLALTNDDARARSTVTAAARPLRSDRLAIDVTPSTPSERPRGTLVQVSVRYRLDVPFAAFAAVDGIDVAATAVRRMEYVP